MTMKQHEMKDAVVPWALAKLIPSGCFEYCAFMWHKTISHIESIEIWKEYNPHDDWRDYLMPAPTLGEILEELGQYGIVKTQSGGNGSAKVTVFMRNGRKNRGVGGTVIVAAMNCWLCIKIKQEARQ